jgi:hypothetical protein
MKIDVKYLALAAVAVVGIWAMYDRASTNAYNARFAAAGGPQIQY